MGMSDTVLLVTSNEVFYNSLEGSLNELNKIKTKLEILYIGNTKIDIAYSITKILAVSKKDKYSKILIFNPVQCPDINIPIGEFIQADSNIEWDKPAVDSHWYVLQCLDIDRVVTGKSISGDRPCINKTPFIMQNKMVDVATFPVARVAEKFNIPVISIGIVADHCTVNFMKHLLSIEKELSCKMIGFLKSNLISLLGK